MKLSPLLLSLLTVAPCYAHDTWSNGDKVPGWIKAACCGPADAHHLRPDQVHDMGDYYKVDGYNANGGKIPHRTALPSQDGDYWIFYRDGDGLSTQSGVYCFFIPMAF